MVQLILISTRLELQWTVIENFIRQVSSITMIPGVIAFPGNIPRTGKYIIGTIQSLAVF
ncbi:hypothetical protein [Citrobacter sp. R56]|uniref:hypothetical protein n=1 Tax=Citrobacter sp. R56 TaxID=1573676 RepID=UPI00193B2E51|nr:hypothetical protein [Citrobacter sp. R56]QRG78303.1 hypothetical protein JM656_17090 [Citrobacter sp. R56]